jgi:hypothetical protein
MHPTKTQQLAGVIENKSKWCTLPSNKQIAWNIAMTTETLPSSGSLTK